MDNINKSWLVDYPPEIRLLVYDHFFSLMNVGIHATETNKSRTDTDTDSSPGCPFVQGKDSKSNQWWKYRQQKMLNLLLTCKAVNTEATPFFYKSCSFEIVDCHCWAKGRLPKFARQRIRNVISPTLGQSNCIERLERVFQMSELSGPKCPKRLTIVPVVFAAGLEDSKRAGRRTFNHLLDVLFATRYELKELRCWLVDQDHRLCHMVIDCKYNARVYVPYPTGVDTDVLLQELKAKCKVVNKVTFTQEDRVKVVHDFMVLSKERDCWLQMREFQNIQR